MNEARTEATRELSVRSHDPLCASASLSYFDDELTPTRRFFIRNHFGIPTLDPSRWALSVWGEVEKPFMVRYEDLKGLPSKELVLDQPFRGFHENDYYVFVAEGERDSSMAQRVTTIRVKSLITWPGRGGLLPLGSHRIRGVAWSGHGTISQVEVSTNNSRSWDRAALQGPLSPYAWQRWEHRWEVRKPGYYLIQARATDSRGDTQPLHAPWNFRGYAVNSLHTVPVTVANL